MTATPLLLLAVVVPSNTSQLLILNRIFFVMETHLLHFFVSQSNLDAVRLIVQAYPQILSVRKNGKLPLHVALLSYEDRGYGWNKKILLHFIHNFLQ